VEPFLIAVLSVLFLVLFFLFYYAVMHTRRQPARPRLCPLCGKPLKIGENLVAERTGVVTGGREKILIKGCPYCLGAKYEVLSGNPFTV